MFTTSQVLGLTIPADALETEGNTVQPDPMPHVCPPVEAYPDTLCIHGAPWGEHCSNHPENHVECQGCAVIGDGEEHCTVCGPAAPWPCPLEAGSKPWPIRVVSAYRMDEAVISGNRALIEHADAVSRHARAVVRHEDIRSRLTGALGVAENEATRLREEVEEAHKDSHFAWIAFYVAAIALAAVALAWILTAH